MVSFLTNKSVDRLPYTSSLKAEIYKNDENKSIIKNIYLTLEEAQAQGLKLWIWLWMLYWAGWKTQYVIKAVQSTDMKFREDFRLGVEW